MVGQYGVRNEINQLIRYYFDSKEDYRLAAKRAPNDETRLRLEDLCKHREAFHMQLQQAVTRHGIEMSDNGTVSADFKRDWERVRGSVIGHGFEAALQLAEKSESHALATAVDVLPRLESADLRALVEKHIADLKSAHDYVQSLLPASHAKS